MPAAAVSVTSAFEVMTNHNAVVAFAFGGSGNVKEFTRREDIHLHDCSDFEAAIAFRAELLDHRRRILVQSGLDHRTEYLFRDIFDFARAESNLNSRIAVPLLCLDIKNDAGSGLNDRNRNKCSLLVVDLSHTDFLSDNTFHSAPSGHLPSRKRPWCPSFFAPARKRIPRTGVFSLELFSNLQ